jgi:hypothetical protein
MTIPSPFWGKLNRMGGSFRGLPEAMRFDRFQRSGNICGRDKDRRLPIMTVIRTDAPGFEDVQENEKIDGWEHVQYLGEHMVRSYSHT